MKRVILFLGFLYISTLVLLGSTNLSDFNIYDTVVRKNSQVIEQGIKIQYTQQDMNASEIMRFLELEGEPSMYGENFSYIMEEKNYLLEVRGIDSFIEIEFIFNDNSIKVENLEKILRNKFRDKNDLSVFTFVKGKISDVHSLDLNIEGVKEVSTLDINGGKTGMIKTFNNKSYNYSVMSYEKDNNYIIVGSPVIFISY